MPPTTGESEMGPSATTPPAQPAPAQPGQAAPPEQGQGQAQFSSNDLMTATFVCMLGPLKLNEANYQSSMNPSSTSQGSMSQGSTGQGSTGQGSTGQGSMGQGSTGQGSTGQSGLQAAADQCVMVAQATNVPATSIARGDPAALDTVRKTLDSRLSAEGASQSASNAQLSLYDKGISAIKEARVADMAVHGPEAAGGVGGGPSSSSSSSSGHGSSAQGSTSKKPTGSSTSSTQPNPHADEIRAHRALGELYQFGRSQGATDTGTQAQALAWVIAVARFSEARDLPPGSKAYAAEPLFSGIMNVPPPTPTGGRAAPTWNEYLNAATRSAGYAPGHAVGGGPTAATEKANLMQIAKSTEERLQVLGQQLPPSSPLRGEVDRTIAHLRAIEAEAASTSGGTTTPPSHGTTQPKKPPPAQTTPKQQPSQPK